MHKTACQTHRQYSLQYTDYYRALLIHAEVFKRTSNKSRHRTSRWEAPSRNGKLINLPNTCKNIGSEIIDYYSLSQTMHNTALQPLSHFLQNVTHIYVHQTSQVTGSSSLIFFFLFFPSLATPLFHTTISFKSSTLQNHNPSKYFLPNLLPYVIVKFFSAPPLVVYMYWYHPLSFTSVLFSLPPSFLLNPNLELPEELHAHKWLQTTCQKNRNNNNNKKKQ